MTAAVRQILTYFARYGVKRGTRRAVSKLRSPVFRPLLLESLRRAVTASTPKAVQDHPVLASAISRADCARLLRSADVLILSNAIGGGADSFRVKLQRDLATGGTVTLVMLYNEPARSYTVEGTLNGESFGAEIGSGKDARLFLEKNLPGSIFVNSLAAWPEPVAWLEWLALQAHIIPVQVYLHDYFCLCPTIVLLNRAFAFCGLPESCATCSACLRENLFAAPYTPVSMRAWRTAWEALLHACSAVRAPHETVRELVKRIYPGIASKIAICHDAALAPLNRGLDHSPLDPSLPTTIAVAGTLGIHKGGLIVAELARLLRRSGRAERLVVIGEMAVPFRKNILEVTGAYRREDLPRLLSRYAATVCLVPSVWPETFCYVVDELMSLGMPLVCFDIGAQGAKVRNYTHGSTVSSMNADACLAALREMEKRRTGYRENS